ncbi:MAG: M28 family peptidase [Desulfobacca sp.]|uniref:M28 family peptidase n=1 Tax=Desulfobacca sp. TaxID=2067990 RepID=UPI004049B0ED
MIDKLDLQRRLMDHVRYLSDTLGDRSVYRPQPLQAAAAYVSQHLGALGMPLQHQSFLYLKQEVANIIAGWQDPNGYYILGAHYDTVAGTPGADDNASGVAVLLETARLASTLPPPLPWTFIGFTTEEPPAFFTPYMGSRVYAKRAKAAGHIIKGMLCLEMVGYYRQEPGSQPLPFPLQYLGYPTTGNFIGLVADRRSRPLLTALDQALRRGCHLPTAAIAIPLGGYLLPESRLSDHANFWDQGYPAVMLTDTAFLRNPHYHGPGDVMATLDFDAMVELTLGLYYFIRQHC